DSTGAFACGAFAGSRPGGLLMGARDGAVDAGERQLRVSLCHHVGHDLVPHAAHRPAAKPQVGMVPIAQFSRDRPPFGTVVEPPDNRFNRAPILLARPRTTNVHRLTLSSPAWCSLRGPPQGSRDRQSHAERA